MNARMKLENDEPGFVAKVLIDSIMHQGSKKDGCNNDWRGLGSMYHLVKALSHLAQHIKQAIDPRSKDNENHLHKAMTRLAMAATIERIK
jgi:hypothetical protein